MSQMPPPEGSWVPGPLGSWPQPATVQWPPPRPPRRGGALKWVLGAVALLAVIGLTVVVTLAVVGRGGGSSEEAAGGGDSDIASANDTGPVSVITDDPSCAALTAIVEFSALQQRNGWEHRDPSIAASEWTPVVRAQHEAVAQSFRSTSDMFLPVAKTTPHRVMRELIEQVVAYSRAYADAIPNYVPANNDLALTAILAGDAIDGICTTIWFDTVRRHLSAANPSVDMPLETTSGDGDSPVMFLSKGDSVCEEWLDTWNAYNADTEKWRDTDPGIPRSQWSPEQLELNNEVAPIMLESVNRIRDIARKSKNGLLRDFLHLAALYREMYVEAISSYLPQDKYLNAVSVRLTGMVAVACRAALNSLR